jgi:hypothetical protein
VGVKIAGATNQISGNFIGTNAAGTAAVGNTDAININGDGNTIGGATAAHGNVISGNTTGIDIDVAVVDGLRGGPTSQALIPVTSSNNVITNNYIGVAFDGVTPLGNAGAGVNLGTGAQSNQIGQAGAGNVISGNGTAIVFAAANSSLNSVQDNLIGLGADATTPVGNINGAIVMLGGSGNAIGGLGAGESNTIANNGGAGVNITGTGTANTIFANAIPSYATLPIDLRGNGVLDASDTGDADTGFANNAQNTPVLSSAVVNGSFLDFTVSVDSSASGAGSLRIEVFEANAGGGPLSPLGTVCTGTLLASSTFSVPVGSVVPGDSVVATTGSETSDVPSPTVPQPARA